MKNSVPGLYRGIQVWKLLGSGGTMTLDQVAVQSGYPKASVLRMLKTLCDLQLAERTAEGLYRAAARVVYSAGAAPDFEKQVEEALGRISEELQATVEWFEPGEDGLLLSRRASPPDAEVRIKARTGFVREWNDEAEAVAVLGYAFYSAAPPLGSLWVYGLKGEEIRLSKTDATVRVDAARESGLATDACYNLNGVKRIAASVVRDGELVGVLSLALVFTPLLELRLAQMSEVLRRAADELQKF